MSILSNKIDFGVIGEGTSYYVSTFQFRFPSFRKTVHLFA